MKYVTKPTVKSGPAVPSTKMIPYRNEAQLSHQTNSKTLAHSSEHNTVNGKHVQVKSSQVNEFS